MAEASAGDSRLDDWLAEVAAELEILHLEVDTDVILDLASVAAHNVVRPAAPLTTFVAGLAAGLAGGTPDDIRHAIQKAVALCERQGADPDPDHPETAGEGS